MSVVRRIAQNAGAAADDVPAGSDSVEPGRSLIRIGTDRGASLAERIGNHLHRLAWRTPFGALRLRGRYPLKLLGVPRDPIAGDVAAGTALLEGEIALGREHADVETLDFTDAARA